jgi:hypothetical protein
VLKLRFGRTLALTHGGLRADPPATWGSSPGLSGLAPSRSSNCREAAKASAPSSSGVARDALATTDPSPVDSNASRDRRATCARFSAVDTAADATTGEGEGSEGIGLPASPGSGRRLGAGAGMRAGRGSEGAAASAMDRLWKAGAGVVGLAGVAWLA